MSVCRFYSRFPWFVHWFVATERIGSAAGSFALRAAQRKSSRRFLSVGPCVTRGAPSFQGRTPREREKERRRQPHSVGCGVTDFSFAMADEPRRAPPVVEIVLPTYITKPAEDEKFYPSKVEALAEKVGECRKRSENITTGRDLPAGACGSMVSTRILDQFSACRVGLTSDAPK